jgi:hypothetical protein
MSTVESQALRHEVKFAASPARYHDLESWIRLHPGGFERSYPARHVNNVYFDTPDLAAYRENLSGTSRRTKLRLRWYGDTLSPNSAVIELKHRRNHLGWKSRYALGPLDFSAQSWRKINRTIRDQLPKTGRLWFDAQPQPILINRYDREYFERPERDVRITLDWRQSVFDQRLQPRPNLRRRANLPDSLVVEIKFSAADREIGQQMIQGIPIRASRNSKYAIAVQSILGY